MRWFNSPQTIAMSGGYNVWGTNIGEIATQYGLSPTSMIAYQEYYSWARTRSLAVYQLVGQVAYNHNMGPVYDTRVSIDQEWGIYNYVVGKEALVPGGPVFNYEYGAGINRKVRKNVFELGLPLILRRLKDELSRPIGDANPGIRLYSAIWPMDFDRLLILGRPESGLKNRDF